MGLVAVGHASAAIRYASPNGVTSPTCPASAPCGLQEAFANAPTFGDQVVLAPGNYGSPSSPLPGMFSTNVTKIGPAPGSPRPHLYFGGTSSFAPYNGAVLSNVEIDSTSTTPAVRPYGSSVENSVIRSSTSSACGGTHAVQYRNTVCISTAAFGSGVEIVSGSGTPQAIELRNVTAWAPGAGGKGISISSTSGTALTTSILNTIARGETADIIAASDGSTGNNSVVTVQNSNFSRPLALGGGASVTAATANSNQSSAPLFVDPANLDLSEAIGSPTIDAGVVSPTGDLFDVINHLRTQGGGTDIGAYEFTPVASAVTALAVAPPKFRAAKKGAMISAKKKKAPIGGTISVTVNQTSAVKLTFERAKPGRKSGKSCVRVTKKNAKRKKCTRYAGIPGLFWLNVPTGTKTAVISGRSLKKKPLVPGKYRVQATPVAVGAAAGLPTYAKFSIVR